MKDLTDHQRRQLQLLADIEKTGVQIMDSLRPERVLLGCVNMSVLAALIRRNLINITVTEEGQRALATRPI